MNKNIYLNISAIWTKQKVALYQINMCAIKSLSFTLFNRTITIYSCTTPLPFKSLVQPDSTTGVPLWSNPYWTVQPRCVTVACVCCLCGVWILFPAVYLWSLSFALNLYFLVPLFLNLCWYIIQWVCCWLKLGLLFLRSHNVRVVLTHSLLALMWLL